MNKLRHLINIVASLLLLTLLVAISVVMLSGIPSGKLPISFIGLFAGFPFLAHAWTIVVSWRQADRLKLQTAVWGLGLASISLFTWVVLGTAFLEMMLQDKGTRSIWQFVLFGTGLFILPISGFLNLVYFRDRLIAEN